jgi:hypothetical protein
LSVLRKGGNGKERRGCEEQPGRAGGAGGLIFHIGIIMNQPAIPPPKRNALAPKRADLSTNRRIGTGIARFDTMLWHTYMACLTTASGNDAPSRSASVEWKLAVLT